jgi:Sec-independent protein translocase protein TatA
MGDFSFGEMAIIAIFAILIYGKELPQAARKLASLYGKLKRQLSDVRYELERQIPAEDLKIDTAISTDPGMDPPPTPSGVLASGSSDQITVTWNSSNNASSYMVRRCKGDNDPWLVVASYVVDLTFSDSDVEPGATYRYTVSAQNSAGESGESDVATATLGASEGSSTPAAETPPAAEAAPEPPPDPAPPAGEPGPAAPSA